VGVVEEVVETARRRRGGKLIFRTLLKSGRAKRGLIFFMRS
jgi:hypothetical protein